MKCCLDGKQIISHYQKVKKEIQKGKFSSQQKRSCYLHILCGAAERPPNEILSFIILAWIQSHQIHLHSTIEHFCLIFLEFVEGFQEDSDVWEIELLEDLAITLSQCGIQLPVQVTFHSVQPNGGCSFLNSRM